MSTLSHTLDPLTILVIDPYARGILTGCFAQGPHTQVREVCGLAEAAVLGQEQTFDLAIIEQRFFESCSMRALRALEMQLQLRLLPMCPKERAAPMVDESSETIDLSEELDADGATADALELIWDAAVVVVDERVVFANEVARSMLGSAVDVGRSLPQGLGDHQVARFNGRAIQLRSRELDWQGAEGRLLVLRDPLAQPQSRELQDQLEHSERLAAMGQMAAGVAHEVNNPAAFVMANLTVVQTDYLENIQRCMNELHKLAQNGTKEAYEQFKEVTERYGAERLLAEMKVIVSENLEGMSRVCSIVRDLKNFSRIEKEVVERVHPNEVVNAACALVHNQVRFKAKLIKDLGSPSKIAADPGKLTQVVMNLLLNAAQAMPEGSHKDNFIRVRTSERDGQVVISVSDSGAGIPDAIKARIFEPFFTTKGKNKGTGLGLSLCADIVRQHKGDIKVFSIVGKGSRFEAAFPIDTGLVPAEPKLKPSAVSVQLKPLRILLIDDEEMLLRAYRRVLSTKHEVFTVNGGAEAIEHLRTRQAYDVVICDLMMPQVDGIKVYDAIRELAPHLLDRLLFCSGGAFTDRMKGFADSVSTPVLEKPVKPDALRSAIASIVETTCIVKPPPLETVSLEQAVAVGPPTRRF